MVVHSDLAYPEGVAAAEILKAGSHSKDTDGKSSGLKDIMAGSVISGIVALLTNGFQVIAGGLSLWFPVGRGISQIACGYSGALVGAGYLIGLTSGLAILVGIIIAWCGFVPYYTVPASCRMV